MSPTKGTISKGKFIFQPLIFRRYVSLWKEHHFYGGSNLTHMLMPKFIDFASNPVQLWYILQTCIYKIHTPYRATPLVPKWRIFWKIWQKKTWSVTPKKRGRLGSRYTLINSCTTVVILYIYTYLHTAHTHTLYVYIYMHMYTYRYLLTLQNCYIPVISLFVGVFLGKARLYSFFTWDPSTFPASQELEKRLEEVDLGIQRGEVLSRKDRGSHRTVGKMFFLTFENMPFGRGNKQPDLGGLLIMVSNNGY